jgi:hypothetical protein
MTLYAGETVIVTHTASLEGKAITGPEVAEVNIIIYDSAGVELVAETAMTWVLANLRWEYEWDTSPGATPVNISAGTYRAKVTIVGVDDSTNWEYKRIRLANNPV